MSLVENEPRIRGQNRPRAARRFGQNERVVDDYEMGLCRRLARAENEAARIIRATSRAAFFAGARDKRARKSVVSIKITVFRSFKPLDKTGHLILLLLRHRPIAGREEVAESP